MFLQGFIIFLRRDGGNGIRVPPLPGDRDLRRTLSLRELGDRKRGVLCLRGPYSDAIVDRQRDEVEKRQIDEEEKKTAEVKS